MKIAPIEGFWTSLRPEIELLICCARLDLAPGGRERIVHLLGAKIDWADLMGMASWHGLTPLLYRHLNALAPGAVPRAMLIALWGNHERNARRNRAMARELSAILKLFEANGVPAIGYKGPSLALAVYADLALREFGDLDILLRKQDVLRAKALLQADGYVAEYALEPAVEAAFLRARTQYHLVLRHPARAVMVELHWKTDADFPVEPADDAAWWANLTFVDFADGRIRCFSMEELLLVLCVHGSKHAWSSLGWLVDVAELIRQHPDLDWDWITGRAARLQCERRLAVGLYLAVHLLEAPLPGKIRGKIEDATEAKRLGGRILGTLSRSGHEATSVFETLRTNLNLYERPRQKIAYCVTVVLAPSLVEWSRWPLPRSLFFLYFPLRIFRLIAKYGPRIARRRR